eukprot:2618168-Amphidinium_carterae.1
MDKIASAVVGSIDEFKNKHRDKLTLLLDRTETGALRSLKGVEETLHTEPMGCFKQLKWVGPAWRILFLNSVMAGRMDTTVSAN